MNDRLDSLEGSPGPFAAFHFREFRLYFYLQHRQLDADHGHKLASL